MIAQWFKKLLSNIIWYPETQEPVEDKNSLYVQNFDSVPVNLCFVRVYDDDGEIFYDLVPIHLLGDHIKNLTTNCGYMAGVMPERKVPPCSFRYFPVDIKSYSICTWKSGTDFYF